ncbi:MAG: DUF1573 domain-containing protein [Planctomycetaceae bacterium]|jgi:hypothetical protein|nr:DUF1573 domain-containing protein [Planctomycetaceae bacterium]
MVYKKSLLEKMKVEKLVFNFRVVPFIFAIIFLLFSLHRTIVYHGSQTVQGLWQPVLVCNQSVYDFGKINVVTNPSHSFVIKNIGNNSLFIRSVSPGCGACVEVIEYTKSSVPPQKSGTVSIKLLTQNLYGKVSKEVLVKTNDPKNPNLILTLEAEVIRPEKSGNNKSDNKEVAEQSP